MNLQIYGFNVYLLYMKTFKWMLIVCLIVFQAGPGYCRQADDDEESASSGNSALTSALMGGLLGAGLGAAIGSASGHAGQGAAIGAGVGAVGGTLLGAEKERNQRQSSYSAAQPEIQPEIESPKDVKIKKKIIREYDDEGNVISEKEVPVR